MGRTAGPRHGPRAIDVDVLLVGPGSRARTSSPLPHPEVCSRRFVLVPVLELEPDLAAPGWHFATGLPDIAAARPAGEPGRVAAAPDGIIPPCSSRSTSATPRPTSAPLTVPSWSSIGASRRTAKRRATSSPRCCTTSSSLRDIRFDRDPRRGGVIRCAAPGVRVPSHVRALSEARGADGRPWHQDRDADSARESARAWTRPPGKRRCGLRPLRRRLRDRGLRDRDQLRRGLTPPASIWGGSSAPGSRFRSRPSPPAPHASQRSTSPSRAS